MADPNFINDVGQYQAPTFNIKLGKPQHKYECIKYFLKRNKYQLEFEKEQK